MEFTEKKFVIFLGKKTISALCFKKGDKPISFNNKTLADKYTNNFFNSNKLNNDYMTALIEQINYFIHIFENECSRDEISIYAASEFRACLNDSDIIYFKMKIFESTGVHTFILTNELERLYIENLVPTCNQDRIVMRIMSTATIVYFISAIGQMNQIRFEDLGTATLYRLLSDINKVSINKIRRSIQEKMSNETIENYLLILKKIIHQKMKSNFSDLDLKLYPKMAIYLGGEIDFLKEINYVLENNDIFQDDEHQYSISFEDFHKQSISKVLEKSNEYLNQEAIGLEEAWKEGIKPCTLIAIAIFQAFSINTIIPSNKKEYFGMYYKNFSKVVITGSRSKNGEEVEALVDYFTKKGIDVHSPKIGENSNNKILSEAEHLQSMSQCDTLIVCNSQDDGYIGDSTLFDIGYALAKGKRVIATKRPRKDLFNLIAVEIGIYGEE